MNGTGVGFSVERQYVTQLPVVAETFQPCDTIVHVEDSKEGWAYALRELIALLYAGRIPSWDTSQVRAAGTKLKTFGGRASGPEPLEDLFRFAVATFKKAAGRRLQSVECHDLMCKIGEIVVVGGVRRSALISLSNLSDQRMRDAKAGAWWEDTPHRRLANNSVAYTEKPDVGSFMEEWLSLYHSKSGERGIFNRVAAQKQAAKYGRRDPLIDYGCNPCSEIILRPYQFCNLSTVICRQDDTLTTLTKKIEVATILGTIQSTMTDFPYLRDIWRSNTEEERLLGVSLCGIQDCPALLDATDQELDALRMTTRQTNSAWADILAIPESAAITCVKPEGTVSQRVDAASWIHARYAPYYLRRVRQDNKDPLTQLMIDEGVPHEPCVMDPDNTTIFEFPQAAPEGARITTDLTAVGQLDLWLKFQRHWCEHKPSITVSVQEGEWPVVGAWVWDHFEEMSGASFLPWSDHTYRQAPYEEITMREYRDRVQGMPKVAWSQLSKYEHADNTKGSQELACVAGMCELAI